MWYNTHSCSLPNSSPTGNLSLAPALHVVKMRRFLATSGFLLSVFASVVTLTLFFREQESASTDAQLAIQLSFYFSMFLLALIIWREYTYARKARYAETIKDLAEISRSLQSAAAGDPTRSEIRSACERSLNSLATILSLITATRCSACIKVIDAAEAAEGTDVRPQVVTMCRDRGSGDSRKKLTTEHWIDQNTDFEQLHENAGKPSGRAFFSNYLPGLRDYKNSSFKVYEKPTSFDVPVLSDVVRHLTWTLPYKSTIVAAISGSQVELGDGSGLVGYLCVDSRSSGAFSRRYDVELVTGIADCLFDLIDRYIAPESAQQQGETHGQRQGDREVH